jgi:hypothetical protein
MRRIGAATRPRLICIGSHNASPVAIILGEKDAEAYGLEPSIPFPWDDEKQIYYIKAFHHIHCLVSISHRESDFAWLTNSLENHSQGL